MYEERAVEIRGAVTRAMLAADLDALNAVAKTVDGFPLGVDPCFETPWLHCAIEAGNHLPVIAWMLDRGCDAAFVDDMDRWPLEQACMATPFKPEIAKVLLEAGAKIDQGDCLGYTALHLTAEQGRRDAVLWLLENGADPFAEQRDFHGRKP